MIARTIEVLHSLRYSTQLLFRFVSDEMAGLNYSNSWPFLQSSNALALPAACSVLVMPSTD